MPLTSPLQTTLTISNTVVIRSLSGSTTLRSVTTGLLLRAPHGGNSPIPLKKAGVDPNATSAESTGALVIAGALEQSATMSVNAKKSGEASVRIVSDLVSGSKGELESQVESEGEDAIEKDSKSNRDEIGIRFHESTSELALFDSLTEA